MGSTPAQCPRPPQRPSLSTDDSVLRANWSHETRKGKSKKEQKQTQKKKNGKQVGRQRVGGNSEAKGDVGH